MTDVKLVLNINTPNYFQNISKPVKRKSDSDVVSVSSKRPKLRIGKSLRVSSSTSKLNIASSINAINSLRPPLNSKWKDASEHSSSKKSKVSFSSTVKYLSNKTETKNLPASPTKSSETFHSDHKKPTGSKNELSKDNQGKQIISSLFSRYPSMPHIKKTDIQPVKEDVFSTKSFAELKIASQIVSNIEKIGYTSMTLVQQLSIPPILEGKDALIRSQTGSGKTLAYAMPVVHKLMTLTPKVERKQGIYALIVVPTRELAVQTYQWMEKLCKACVWVVPGYLIGGEKKKAEKNRIRKGINILVATPGRLTDHIDNTNSLSLQRVQYLVLDEADRMLDMGYEQSIKSIIIALNKQKNENYARQTIMLSATLTSAVMKLAGISLSSPEVINVSSEEAGSLSADTFVTPQNLSQYFMLVPPKLKLVTLSAFILEKCKLSSEKKMLIFMSTQDMVDYHTSLFSLILARFGRRKKSLTLQLRGDEILKINKRSDQWQEEDDGSDIDEDLDDDIHFFKLHGSMTQPERTAVFKSFCEATFGVLLCTDVASRGLDLPRVNWIVQYNAACSVADYVHRVGRTARANTKGSAVVFVNPTESSYISMLEKHGIRFSELRLENVLPVLRNSSLHEDTKIPSSMEAAATDLQNQFEKAVYDDRDLHRMAGQGFVSFVRSYAAIPKEAREHFCFKMLHLGHFAKSFGLRETPSVLGSRGGETKRREFRDKSEEKKNLARNRINQTSKSYGLFNKLTVVSEFDSGLDGIQDETVPAKTVKKKSGKRALNTVKGKSRIKPKKVMSALKSKNGNSALKSTNKYSIVQSKKVKSVFKSKNKRMAVNKLKGVK